MIVGRALSLRRDDNKTNHKILTRVHRMDNVEKHIIGSHIFARPQIRVSYIVFSAHSSLEHDDTYIYVCTYMREHARNVICCVYTRICICKCIAYSLRYITRRQRSLNFPHLRASR